MKKLLEEQTGKVPALAAEAPLSGNNRSAAEAVQTLGKVAERGTPGGQGPPIEYQRHYPLKRAAQILGVSERAMKSAVAKQHIRGIRFGNRTLIPGSEVKRLVEEIDAGAPLAAAE